VTLARQINPENLLQGSSIQMLDSEFCIPFVIIKYMGFHPEIGFHRKFKQSFSFDTILPDLCDYQL
jgi:hypothetical protein